MNFIESMLDTIDGYWALLNLIVAPITIVCLAVYLPVPTLIGGYCLIKMCLASAARNREDLDYWTDYKGPLYDKEKPAEMIRSARAGRNKDVCTAVNLLVLMIGIFGSFGYWFANDTETMCQDRSGEATWITLPGILSHIPHSCPKVAIHYVVESD